MLAMPLARLHWKIFLAITAVLMLGCAAYNYLACYCRAPVRLTISGGNVCPLRSEMAKRIGDEVRSQGILLETVSDTNSDTISTDVDAHRLDLGLVLGGFPPEAHRNVRQVASLGVEPLHLLVRPELLEGTAPSLELLRGRRVSLGERDTNATRLAMDLLRLAGLRATTPTAAGDFEAVYMPEAEAIAQLQSWKRVAPPVRAALAERLPDALFVVDSLPAPLVDELVKTAGYRLVPLPYATALHLDNRRDESRRDESHQADVLLDSRLEAMTIPAYTYGIAPAAPAEDCPTFGLRLLLIAHKDVSTNAVLRLLRSLDQGAAQRYHVDLDAVGVANELPLHPGAEAFAQGRRPMAVNDLLEPLTNFLSVLGAGAAGGLALWGFLRGLRAVHPDVHLKQIDRIERLLAGSELDESAPTLPRDFIGFLEGHLAEIKQAAIDDYSKGRLNNDDALMSILTLIADTRHMLVQRRKQLCLDTIDSARPRRVAEAA
jgi:TRAP-type uncharacterized transport system substrate-binding protein